MLRCANVRLRTDTQSTRRMRACGAGVSLRRRRRREKLPHAWHTRKHCHAFAFTIIHFQGFAQQQQQQRCCANTTYSQAHQRIPATTRIRACGDCCCCVYIVLPVFFRLELQIAKRTNKYARQQRQQQQRRWRDDIGDDVSKRTRTRARPITSIAALQRAHPTAYIHGPALC